MSGIAVEHRRPETAEEMKIRDAVESDLPAIIKITTPRSRLALLLRSWNRSRWKTDTAG